MKKILIFLYLIIVPEYFAQNPSNCREVFLRTENTNGVSVTFTATTYQTYLWNSYYNLVDVFVNNQLHWTGTILDVAMVLT